MPEHIFSPFLRKNQRVGTRSALDQGVGELTAPPTNRTEEAAASRCYPRRPRIVNSSAIGQKGGQSGGRNGRRGCSAYLHYPSAWPVLDKLWARTKYLMEERTINLSISINFTNLNVICILRSAQITSVHYDKYSQGTHAYNQHPD